MSTEAFGSRRVTRSLREIVTYLDEGIKLAGGVGPGQTVRLDLEQPSISLTPRITKVVWQATGSRVITLGPGKTTQALQISGTDLDNPTVFKLVGETSGSTFFETTNITGSSKAGFTATIDLIDPSPVSYLAEALNSAGQPAILEDACEIDEPTSSQQTGGLQLGGIAPNEAAPGDDIDLVLLLLAGQPSDVSDVYITDTQGTRLEDWSPQTLRTDALKSQYAKTYPGVGLVARQFTVPPGQQPGIYCVVAESSTLNSKDRLAFYVRGYSPKKS